LWFNEVRQDGVIQAASGEKFVVSGPAFPDGRGPVGRCAGTPVTFEVLPDGDPPEAVAVSFPQADAPRRARNRARR